MRNHQRISVQAATLSLFLPLLLIACSRSEPAPAPIRAVKVLTVGFDNYSAGHEFAGEVRAQVESRLGFRVGGKIIKRQAELGQHVKAGQLLAELDPQDYRLAVDAARAQAASASTQRDLAAADYKRYKELKDQNFISGAELERREAMLKSAQAQFEQAQSQLSVQGHQANYAALVADVSGVITAVDAEVGQVVAAGTPVFRIAADGVRDVAFAVPEDQVSSFKVGLPVRVRVWAQNNELVGKVREVAASADPATRTYPVKVGLEAGQEPPVLGATVYVMPEGLGGGGVQGKPVIKLPTTALRKEGQGTAVWVLDKASMTVKSQAVQIATADGNEAVVASGLQPGMQVVSAGVHVLSNGEKVTIYQGKPAVAQVATAQSAPNLLANVAASAAVPAPATTASAAK